MIIQSVSLADQVSDLETGRHRASVLISSDRGNLSLLAQAMLPDAENATDISHALVKDAMRQIERMPEFRDGRQKVTLADSALDNLSF